MRWPWGLLGGLALAAAAFADDATYVLVIKDHRWQPATLDLPAHVKLTLTVRNDDPTAEEFESGDLNREKLIAAGGEAKITLGPLEPGRYGFYGEFHQDTARGTLVVK